MNPIIQKLLKGTEVEWKPLGEVGQLIRGNGLQKKDFTETGVPAIHYGQIYTYYGLSTVETKSFVSPQLAEKLKIAYKNDLLITTTSENDDDVLKPVAWFGKKAAISGDMMLFRHSQNVKYLAYYFLTETFKRQKKKYISGTKVRRISKDSLAKILIPIPPLSVQTEIVEILDKFTALTAELTARLTAELTARKKQYNYYRDKLLTFKEGEAEWKTLGEMGQFIRGNGLQKKDFTETGVPAIHYGQIYTYYGLSTVETKSFVSPQLAEKLKKVETGDVVITNTSENLDDVGKAMVYLGKRQAVTGGHASIFKPSKQILGKYFVYFSQTQTFANEKRKYAKGTKVIDVSASDMSKILIPIPPLSEQERIVSILDKFDMLTHSITQGLPREIALRQKQYEYYRAQLLDFPSNNEGA
ncbi:restriction endonuclease subunit S [Entomobacter blattae]|uniref:Type I restriction modification DNA specificity domain protein n=1 Tax=Entomobacter blattae TaxID=2762277 RepID=A0A7H1NRH5_9PROT|nr:restriction endonuclease subunit S [Entomobacter blattae]QNT78385.1 Type I restriction modification DNA specificity domain protein [Entomobacter blattae]